MDSYIFEAKQRLMPQRKESDHEGTPEESKVPAVYCQKLTAGTHTAMEAKLDANQAKDGLQVLQQPSNRCYQSLQSHGDTNTRK
jgi:hypothetical protein